MDKNETMRDSCKLKCQKVKKYHLMELLFMTSALKGSGKWDEVRELSWGGCVKMWTSRGGDKKIRTFCGSHNWKS